MGRRLFKHEMLITNFRTSEPAPPDVGLLDFIGTRTDVAPVRAAKLLSVFLRRRKAVMFAFIR